MVQFCPTNIRIPCMRRNDSDPGLELDELAALLSPFITKASLFLTKSVDEVVGATPFTISFDEVTGNIDFSGNQITLLAGNVYELFLSVRGGFSAAGNAGISFWDITNDVNINGIIAEGHGKTSFIRPMSDATNLTNTPIAAARMTPTQDILVEARIISESNLNEVDAVGTFVSVKQL